jgi:hypothetical protein
MESDQAAMPHLHQEAGWSHSSLPMDGNHRKIQKNKQPPFEL